MKELLIHVYRKLPLKIRKSVKFITSLRKRIVVADGAIQYAQNGLFTKHNADFNHQDGEFHKAYKEACQVTGFSHPSPWRVYVCCWAIKRAVREMEGDLVECGVWKGMTSYSGMLYSNWNLSRRDKSFWLVDSWDGLDEELLVEGESKNYSDKKKSVYKGVFPAVEKTFSNVDAVKLIKGFVPDVLKKVECDKISYLHIDMNSAYPELEAIKYFWDKLVTGAVIVLDDYGFVSHEIQKKVIDEFCNEVGSEVLTLPTGQGIIVKS